VLPIGGLKEKLLAAHRGGISTVIIPDENSKNLIEIPKNIKEKLTIIPVKWIDEVLEIALEKMPNMPNINPEEEEKMEVKRTAVTEKSPLEPNLPH
jgi:ATP-dependent Lon protease